MWFGERGKSVIRIRIKWIRKITLILLLVSVITSTLCIPAHAFIDSSVNNSGFLYSDTLIAPDLPITFSAPTNGSVPPVPGYYETSEFLIGSVAVGVIFLESNGQLMSKLRIGHPPKNQT